MKIRVGFGFDVHQLVAGRELWLGGIRLEHEKGLFTRYLGLLQFLGNYKGTV